MTMKNRLMIATLLFMVLAGGVQAQEQEDDLPQVQDPKVKEKISAIHIAYITEQLGLTPAEAEKFWPIYNEFSSKRKDLRKQLRQERKNPDPNKTQEQNDQELVELHLKVKQQELDLEKDYSSRLLKVISAQKLRTLPEAERRFRQMIIEQIQRRQMQREQGDRIRDRQQQHLRQRNN
jgi:hypothetical protein